MKIKVLLLKDWNGHKKGETVEVEENIAKTLIETKYGEEVADTKTVEEELKSAMADLQAQTKTAVVDAVKSAVADLSIIGKGSKLQIQVGKDGREDDPRGGYESFGQFATDVKLLEAGGGGSDNLKLIMHVERKANGMNEASGEEGGLLIPEEFRAGIWERAQQANDLLSRVEEIPIAGNTYTILQEKGDTMAAGVRNAGVRGYWVEEAGQLTKSQPKFKRSSMRLKKLAVLVYCTDEQLEDSPVSLGAYLSGKAGREIGFMLGDALINGNGVGQPLGVLNSPCLVSVSIEASQAATTLVAENIINAYSRMYAPSRTNAVWNINQDCEPQLFTMTMNVGTGGIPLMMPPGGISGAPYANILGKPVLPSEWNPTVGSVGDVLFADWSQYMMIVKMGAGIKASISIHLKFDYDETVFKFTYRCDGQPMWSSALTPFKSTTTLSPFVAIAVRA